MALTVHSDAFSDGGAIPHDYSCDGGGRKPAISWTDAPEDTRSFAVIVDDPDAPGGTFVHWVAWNLPASAHSLDEAGDVREGVNSAKKPGYIAPCPPPGKPHRYYYKVYALDTDLDLPAKTTKVDLERAMDGHVLAQGQVMGTYGR